MKRILKAPKIRIAGAKIGIDPASLSSRDPVAYAAALKAIV